MTSVLRALDRHWFAPASLRELATVRIVVVATQLLLFYPSLTHQLWLARTDPATYLPIPALKILLIPFGEWGLRPGPMFLHAVWLLGIGAGILALIGLYTRLGMLTFALANTLLIAHRYSYGEYHHPEAIMVIALWVLAVAPVGQAWSLDALRARMQVALGRMRFAPRAAEDDLSTFARWPLRVIQWSLVLVYLSAGLSKVMNSGLSWFNGYTLAYLWIQDGVRFDVLGQGASLGIWLSHHLLLASGLSIAATLFELTFVLAILVPRLTRLYVVGGTGMHTAIYLIQAAAFFQYIVLYVAFLEALRTPLARRGHIQTRARWRVMYDGQCPACIRTMVALDFFDPRRRLTYIDLERDGSRTGHRRSAAAVAGAHHVMQVADQAGHVYRGFFALRALARVLPPLWPLLPLMYAPLASTIGPRLYDGLSRTRDRAPCRVETCHI